VQNQEELAVGLEVERAVARAVARAVDSRAVATEAVATSVVERAEVATVVVARAVVETEVAKKAEETVVETEESMVEGRAGESTRLCTQDDFELACTHGTRKRCSSPSRRTEEYPGT